MEHRDRRVEPHARLGGGPGVTRCPVEEVGGAGTNGQLHALERADDAIGGAGQVVVDQLAELDVGLVVPGGGALDEIGELWLDTGGGPAPERVQLAAQPIGRTAERRRELRRGLGVGAHPGFELGHAGVDVPDHVLDAVGSLVDPLLHIAPEHVTHAPEQRHQTGLHAAKGTGGDPRGPCTASTVDLDMRSSSSRFPVLVGTLALVASLLAAAAVVVAPTAAAYPTENVRFDGHGWGHGRGLGQYGSLGYAVDDHQAYSTILDHYYSNTTKGTQADGLVTVHLLEFDN